MLNVWHLLTILQMIARTVGYGIAKLYTKYMSVTIHDFAFSYDELFNIIHAYYDHIIFNNIISENILIVTGEFNQSILF